MGAINTSRSNLKNTSRAIQTGLVIDLRKPSGEKVATRTVETGSQSELEAKFDFGVVPAGQYVLTIAAANEGTTSDQPAAPSSIIVTIEGAKAGPITRDLILNPSGLAVDTARTQRDLKSDIGLARLYGHIECETDGKNQLQGAVRHDMAKASINNMR